MSLLFYLTVPVGCCIKEIFFNSLVFRHAGLRWQSVKERGGGCHLSVKAALPSSRPGVLGQLASELASVTVEEWTLNNRASSSALPPGWLAGWLAGVTRQDGGQSRLQSITFTWGRGEAERAREGEIELRAGAPFSTLFCMLIPPALRKGSESAGCEMWPFISQKEGKHPPSCLMHSWQPVCAYMHINTWLHFV